MKLEDTILEDTLVLQRWIDADLEHAGGYAIWWMTGNGLLCFKVTDSKGPICFVRLNKPDANNRVAIHTQFAPREDVSKIRLLKGMLWCLPIVINFAREKSKGLVFTSTSETLINFMKIKFSFISTGNDNYVLDFEVV